MKSTIIALLLMVSVTAFGQVNKKEPIKTDSVARVQANDSTLLFSARDLQPLLERLTKMPYESSAPLINYLQQLLVVRMKEWEETQNKPKK